MMGRLAIHRSAYHVLGGYDENMIGWGGDDIDLIMRAQLSGLLPEPFPMRI
jgi:predicted glycosyltransferase involved in capsule biosynthesis